ncbi:MAG: DUF3887 domain-containing protein [Methanomicrobiales archaeon]|nr:DUF3887 domain-containing protein [Methanomicrobiales archaeon]
MKIPILLPLILIAITAVTACGCIGQETVLPEAEQIQVRVYADPITDNLLQGFNENNYTRYSRDFSDEMKQALDASAFQQSRELIIPRIGLYVTRGDAIVIQTGDYLAANYKADFEQEEGVDVRVVFKKGDDSHQIYGLWFNSPKLRT